MGMKRLKQVLCTQTDSFTYCIVGEGEPVYRVDSSGHLYCFKAQKVIGKFYLNGEKWFLSVDNVIKGNGASMFRLPEFELEILTEMVNE